MIQEDGDRETYKNLVKEATENWTLKNNSQRYHLIGADIKKIILLD